MRVHETALVAAGRWRNVVVILAAVALHVAVFHLFFFFPPETEDENSRRGETETERISSPREGRRRRKRENTDLPHCARATWRWSSSWSAGTNYHRRCRCSPSGRGTSAAACNSSASAAGSACTCRRVCSARSVSTCNRWTGCGQTKGNQFGRNEKTNALAEGTRDLFLTNGKSRYLVFRSAHLARADQESASRTCIWHNLFASEHRAWAGRWTWRICRDRAASPACSCSSGHRARSDPADPSTCSSSPARNSRSRWRCCTNRRRTCCRSFPA